MWQLCEQGPRGGGGGTILSSPQNLAIWVFQGYLSYCTPTVSLTCADFLGSRVNTLSLPGGRVVVVCTNIE